MAADFTFRISQLTYQNKNPQYANTLLVQAPEWQSDYQNGRTNLQLMLVYFASNAYNYIN